MRAALDAGMEVDQADAAGVTALHFAAFNNNVDVAKVLLEFGADPNVADAAGQVRSSVVCERKRSVAHQRWVDRPPCTMRPIRPTASVWLRCCYSVVLPLMKRMSLAAHRWLCRWQWYVAIVVVVVCLFSFDRCLPWGSDMIPCTQSCGLPSAFSRLLLRQGATMPQALPLWIAVRYFLVALLTGIHFFVLISWLTVAVPYLTAQIALLYRPHGSTRRVAHRPVGLHT